MVAADADALTEEERNQLLNFERDEHRYRGLVPIETNLEPAPRRISKQVRAEWLREVSPENEPKISDIALPQERMPESQQAQAAAAESSRHTHGDAWSVQSRKFIANRSRTRFRSNYLP